MTHPPLDSRDIRILRWLLGQKESRSTSALASDLGLSDRVVRYRLGAVESFLRSFDVALERQRGVGIWIDATPAQRGVLMAQLSGVGQAPRVYGKAEREHILKASLLWAAPDPTSISRLHDVVEVSEASVRRDLQRSEEWLEQLGLALQRRPGVGIAVVGPETLLRRALVQLTFEAASEDVLMELCARPFDEADLVRVRVPQGVRDHLSGLPLQESSKLVDELLQGSSLDDGNSRLVLTIYVAVTAARLKDGKAVRMVAGHQRSLADHPVAKSIASMPELFWESFGFELPELEFAGLTEYVLGLAELSGGVAVESVTNDELVERLVAVAAQRLNPALSGDIELRRNLAEHLDRLVVRLRYGLPVHNPLLSDVVERYPDVHAVTEDLGQIVSEELGSPIGQDELGFITMYLSGALERYRLKPARKAIVVCPSGMATVWVLVSRIQAEFPQLSIEAVSSVDGSHRLSRANCDLVISTVDLDVEDDAPFEDEVPVVIVNPLLPQSDVRRLATYV